MQETTENGFYHISNEDYHSGPGVSNSNMKQILRSPAHFKSPDPPDTDAMIFGDAFHVATLEPNRYDKEYTVYPADCLPGSGKGQQARKAEFEEYCAATGISIIKPDWHDQIIMMRDAVLTHPKVKEEKLLQDGKTELSAYYTDPDFYNILTKIRMDYLNKSRGCITDLKSTTDARLFPFRKISHDKGYHIQAAHYLYTLTKLTNMLHEEFFFIAVEKPKLKGQYIGVMIYQADEEQINEGLIKRAEALRIYHECVESGNWPGYSTEITPLGLPGYAKRKQDIAIYD
jgi:hypothetical protein